VTPAARPLRLTLRNRYAADRLGWREIVLAAAPGVAVEATTAGADDTSDELRRYPDDLLRAPLDQRA